MIFEPVLPGILEGEVARRCGLSMVCLARFFKFFEAYLAVCDHWTYNDAIMELNFRIYQSLNQPRLTWKLTDCKHHTETKDIHILMKGCRKLERLDGVSGYHIPLTLSIERKRPVVGLSLFGQPFHDEWNVIKYKSAKPLKRKSKTEVSITFLSNYGSKRMKK